MFSPFTKLSSALREGTSPVPAESLGRPLAGFTWIGFYGIAMGAVGSVGVVCGAELFFGVIYLFVPRHPDGTQPGTAVVTNIIEALAALPVLIGCIYAVLAARAYNLSRGTGRGRPVFGWRILLSPRGLARFLFTPAGVYDGERPDDGQLDRVALARSILGLIVIASVVVYYHRTSFDNYMASLYVQGTDTMTFAAVAVLVCCVLSVVLVDQANRGKAARAVLRPLRTVLVVLVLVSALLYYSANVRRTYGTSQQADLKELSIAVALNPHIFWLLLFIVFSIYYINRSMFNVGDAHPLLPAVATLAVVWTLILASLLDSFGVAVPWPTARAEPSIPQTVGLLLSLCGALSTTVLAIWEIVRLRGAGARFRYGAWR